MNLRIVGHAAFVALLTLHAVGLFILPAAASLGQSELARNMLLVLLVSALSSVSCYVINRPGGGVIVASLGAAIAGTMWGLESWKSRPRPAERVEATFPGFKLIVPAGEACFPSFGRDGNVYLTLRPRSGECPRLAEGTTVRLEASHQPVGAVGHFHVPLNLHSKTRISPQQLPKLNPEERRATTGVTFADEIILLGDGMPAPLYSCRSSLCEGAARYKTTLVTVTWWEKPGDQGQQMMMDVARKLESWAR